MTYNELTEEQQNAVDAIKKITSANQDSLTEEQVTEIDSLADKLPDEFQEWIGELLALYDFDD